VGRKEELIDIKRGVLVERKGEGAIERDWKDVLRIENENSNCE